jgi:hypothetical protein
MSQGANGRSTGLRHVTDSTEPDEAARGGIERRTLSPDDALPPVEPPSAGFIIKLFVVPAIIVAVVVGVVLCFQWVAQSEVDVDSLLDSIDRNAKNAWQCAHDLAKVLRQDEALRTDERRATRLSNMVAARINSGPPKGDEEKIVQQEVNVRVYLCKALGEFATPAALPGLLEAVRGISTQAAKAPPDEKVADAIRAGEVAVRKAALEGLALLAHNVQQQGGSIATPEVLSLLLDASREAGADKAAIRLRAAYALGILGGEEVIARLVEMVDPQKEPHTSVRFNAATGLARHGNAQGLDVLRDMIDPSESAAMLADTEQTGPDGKPLPERALAAQRAEMEVIIRHDGLEAVERLLRAGTQVDLTEIAPAIQALRDHPDTHPAVKRKAAQVQNLLKERD